MNHLWGGGGGILGEITNPDVKYTPPPRFHDPIYDFTSRHVAHDSISCPSQYYTEIAVSMSMPISSAQFMQQPSLAGLQSRPVSSETCATSMPRAKWLPLIKSPCWIMLVVHGTELWIGWPEKIITSICMYECIHILELLSLKIVSWEPEGW